MRGEFLAIIRAAFGELARFAHPVKTIECLSETGAGRSTIKCWRLSWPKSRDGSLWAYTYAVRFHRPRAVDLSLP
jgi:hypothetical protein